MPDFTHSARRLLEFLRLHDCAREAFISVKALTNPILQPRRFHAFGLGMGKSGTHSLAAMLSPTFRAQHEAHADRLIFMLLERANGRRSPQQFRRFLQRRDQHLNLELEVSNLFMDFPELLVELFPKAKFFFLIRDPFSWVNSSWNHLATRPASPHWQAFDAWKYGPEASQYHPAEALVLQPLNLPSLARKIHLWTTLNNRALDAIPAHRRVVIPIHDLARSAHLIADFLGIPAKALATERTHAFKRTLNAPDLIFKLDPAFVNATVLQAAAPLLQRYFPNLHSLDDAVHLNFLRPPTP